MRSDPLPAKKAYKQRAQRPILFCELKNRRPCDRQRRFLCMNYLNERIRRNTREMLRNLSLIHI